MSLSPTLNTAKDEGDIIVRLRLSDCPHPMKPDTYFDWLYAEFSKAGIPCDPDGTLIRGTIMRFDDPEDFGVTVWHWKP